MKSSHAENELLWNLMSKGMREFSTRGYATLQSSYGHGVVDFCAEKSKQVPLTDANRNFTDYCGEWAIIGLLSLLNAYWLRLE